MFFTKKRPFVVSVYFKSGNVMTLKVKSMSVTTSPVNGSIVELKWELHTGKILHIDLGQVEAILQEQ